MHQDLPSLQPDDFCYPSSDDVSVLPAAGGWTIRFGHHDQLWFGRERGISA